MIQAAVVNYLKANLSVTRIYPLVAPQGETLPVVTVDLNSAVRFRHFESGDVGTGLIDSDFEISVWASTMLSSTQLNDEIITLLENYKGVMTDPSSPNVTHTIADIRIDSEGQGFNAATELYDHSVFLSITYT